MIILSRSSQKTCRDLPTRWSQNTDITSPTRPSQHHPYWTTVTSRQFFYDYDLLDLTSCKVAKSPSSSKLFTPNLAWLTEAFGLEFNRGALPLLIEINVHEHFIPSRPMFLWDWGWSLDDNQWLVSKCSEIYYGGDKHQSSTDLDCPEKNNNEKNLRLWCDVRSQTYKHLLLLNEIARFYWSVLSPQLNS